MRRTGDYPGEMPAFTRIDDPIAEDLLTGQPVRADLEPLATALETLRAVSQQPVPASLELADRIAAGAFPRRTTRLLTRLATVGVAVALVGGGTAGFAGSLPEPVQERFETVVESVTPFELTRRGAGDPPAEREADHRDEPGPAGDGDDPADFGDRVSEDARTGGVDGPEVSEDARNGEQGAVVEGPGPPAELPPPAQRVPGEERRRAAP